MSRTVCLNAYEGDNRRTQKDEFSDFRRARARSLAAWYEIGFILLLFWVCDRSGLVATSSKDKQNIDVLYATVLLLLLYNRNSVTPTSTHQPLGREQTDETKGWMQIGFLLYHYFNVREMYIFVRVFIATYVWLTGFGNFSFYVCTNNFSGERFIKMLWRLNFFVILMCLVMRNSYVLYYICPLHTFYSILIYFVLRAGHDWNSKSSLMWVKFAVCFLAMALIWEIDGVSYFVFKPFTFILGYRNPAARDLHVLHEWCFRAGLDRYIWIYGMMCAYARPRCLHAIAWMERHSTTRKIMFYQCTVALTSTITLYFWYKVFGHMNRIEYNTWHPHTSWIPITAFFLLRNSTKSLREYHVAFFRECGKTTLETYLAQFHIWLSTGRVPDAQPKMLTCFVPGFPATNFVLCTYVFVQVSQRAHLLTNELKDSLFAWKYHNEKITCPVNV